MSDLGREVGSQMGIGQDPGVLGVSFEGPRAPDCPCAPTGIEQAVPGIDVSPAELTAQVTARVVKAGLRTHIPGMGLEAFETTHPHIRLGLE